MLLLFIWKADIFLKGQSALTLCFMYYTWRKNIYQIVARILKYLKTKDYAKLKYSFEGNCCNLSFSKQENISVFEIFETLTSSHLCFYYTE